MKFWVWVKPRAKQSKVLDKTDQTTTADGHEAVHIALAAPPIDGAANEELVRFLAAQLEVPKRSIRVVRGHAARHKQIEVDEVSVEELQRRLHPA